MGGLGNFWMIYGGDYLRDTMHLSAEQHGMYFLMLNHYYSTGEPLPNDEEVLARVSRVSVDAWLRNRNVILKFFTQDVDGRWRNKRADEEIAKRQRLSGRASKGAAARWGAKADATADATANAKPIAPQPLPLPQEDKNTASPSATRSSSEGSDDPRPKRVKPQFDLAPAVEVYNQTAARVGWSQVSLLSETRKTALRARLAEAGGHDGWVAAMAKAEASGFLTGKRGGDRSWRPNFDWFCKQANFIKLMEGKYDDRDDAGAGDHSGGTVTDTALRGILGSGKGYK
jgi:uncharacterized protein YdaU (DUF1376 family)